MYWLELGLQVAIQIAIYAAIAGFLRLLFSLFPTPGPQQQGIETGYPVPWRNSWLFIVMGAVLLAGTVYLALSGLLWALVSMSLAAILLLAIPGEIVTDARGIRQTPRFLLPGRPRVLPWDEIDSLYEKVDRTQYGSFCTAIVSAGPDRTIEFSAWHVGREEFVKAVEARGTPVVRVPKPQ